MTSPTSSTAGNILAIDTSGTRGSLALAKGAVRFAVEWDKKAMHSELATVKLQELLAAANLPLQELDRILVNAGPGSFTGIRVGMNLARTLAYSLSIPIASFNSLRILAHLHGGGQRSVFIAIRAIQTFYYAAGYAYADAGEGRLAERLAPASVAEPDLPALSAAFEKILVEGQTAGFSAGLGATAMLDLVAHWPEEARYSTWNEVRPIYIRASEAEEKLLKGLLKA